MERAVPVLPVDDLRLAREFYVDKLGFSVRFEASEDGRTGLLGIARGSIAITLDCPMDGHGRQACVSLEVEKRGSVLRRVELTRSGGAGTPRRDMGRSHLRPAGPVRQHDLRDRSSQAGTSLTEQAKK
jgi:catechol 2,3-dioxygenase-like lactoylglutathione lyase family enzyme